MVIKVGIGVAPTLVKRRGSVPPPPANLPPITPPPTNPPTPSGRAFSNAFSRAFG